MRGRANSAASLIGSKVRARQLSRQRTRGGGFVVTTMGEFQRALGAKLLQKGEGGQVTTYYSLRSSNV